MEGPCCRWMWKMFTALAEVCEAPCECQKVLQTGYMQASCLQKALLRAHG